MQDHTTLASGSDALPDPDSENGRGRNVSSRYQPKKVLALAACMALLPLAGCLDPLSIDAPEAIVPGVEPELGGEYLLYRPSTYDRNQAWPLIVVCHGRAGDSAVKQQQHWASAAESHGFLVVTPVLRSGPGASVGSGEDTLKRLADDEQHILKTVRHVQAGHTVSVDRVFIYGYGSGVSAALYAGLRNPDIFRAVALVQPRYKGDPPAPAMARVHAFQPVLVAYSTDDAIRGRHGQSLATWLREHRVHVREEAGGRLRPEDTIPTVTFLEDVVRKEPWAIMEIAADENGDANTRWFRLRSSFQPAIYRWEFGDGEESPVSAPVHRYAQPGTYTAQLTLTLKNGESLTRREEVSVP